MQHKAMYIQLTGEKITMTFKWTHKYLLPTNRLSSSIIPDQKMNLWCSIVHNILAKHSVKVKYMNRCTDMYLLNLRIVLQLYNHRTLSI